MILRHTSNRLTDLLVLAAGTFVLGTDGFLLSGLLPQVARDLHVGIAEAGQLTTVFAVVYAVASPLIAAATGRLDRRTVLLGGMALFVVGMLLQATGASYGVVLSGRVLAAAGAAGFQANAYGLAGYLAPPERRGRALAAVAAGYSVATIVGVPLGVLLGQTVGWRGATWVVAALAVVSGALVVRLPAVHLPAPTLRERLAIFRTPTIAVLLVTTAVVLTPQGVIMSYIAPLVGAQSPSSPAVLTALLVFGLAVFAGNRLVGTLTDRLGAVRALVGGVSVATLALGALSLAYPVLAPMLVALAALGLTNAFLVVPQQTRLIAASGPNMTVALGFNGSMLYVGTALGAAVGGATLSALGTSWISPVTAGIALVGLVLVLVTVRPVATWSRRGAEPQAMEPVAD